MPSPPPPALDDDVTSQVEALTGPLQAVSERVITQSRELRSLHHNLQSLLVKE